MTNAEGFLEEVAFELAFKQDEESGEERLLDRMGLEWKGRRGNRGADKTSHRVQGWVAGFQEKESRETSLGPRDCRQKLEVSLNFLLNLCLSGRAPNRVAEAAWGSGRILLCFSNYPVTHQKIILSWEEGRFGVENCCCGSAGGLIGIHKSAF